MAALLASAVWATSQVPVRWLIGITAASLAVIVGGAVFGWALYPWSDLATVALGLFGGVLLGRTYPASPRAFLILLLVLSVLDLAQNLAFAGPAPSSATPPNTAPDPHLIWLNFRIPLPSGHLNIGFADLVLIAAMTEHLRRHQAPFAISVMPGIVGLLLAELAFDLHRPTGPIDTALLESLVPDLTVGWLLALAVLKRSRSG